MKKSILTTVLLNSFIGLSLFAQMVPKGTLDVNYIHLPIYRINNLLFHSVQDTVSNGARIINNTLNEKIIFASSLWLSSRDKEDSLYVSAGFFGQAGNDFTFGPLDSTTHESYPLNLAKYNRVWKINRAQIEYFKLNYNNSNYTIPETILSWPAHGEGNLSRNLAPFIDVNNNGIYEPKFGDYPLMRGDQMIYWIVNDKESGKPQVERESKGKPLGAEIHGCLYAYQCFDSNSDLADIVNYTVFAHFDVYNRSNMDYDDFKVGVFNDNELGCFNNDMAAYIPSKNMSIVYNADSFNQCPGWGFGTGNPKTELPVFGLKFFDNNPLNGFIKFNNDAHPINGNPNINGNPRTDLNVDKYLSGNYLNDSMRYRDIILDSADAYNMNWPLKGDSTNDYKFTGYDIRTVHSLHKDKLSQGEKFSFDYFMFAANADKSGKNIMEMGDIINTWVNTNTIPSCFDLQKNLSAKNITNSNSEPIVYPNPATNILNINILQEQGAKAIVYNAMGNIVLFLDLNSSINTIDINHFSSGLYYVSVVTKTNTFISKVVKL